MHRRVTQSAVGKTGSGHSATSARRLRSPGRKPPREAPRAAARLLDTSGSGSHVHRRTRSAPHLLHGQPQVVKLLFERGAALHAVVGDKQQLLALLAAVEGRRGFELQARGTRAFTAACIRAGPPPRQCWPAKRAAAVPHDAACACVRAGLRRTRPLSICSASLALSISVLPFHRVPSRSNTQQSYLDCESWGLSARASVAEVQAPCCVLEAHQGITPAPGACCIAAAAAAACLYAKG